MNYSTINDTCSAACWCRQLRQWITRQFDRNLDILTIDTYFKLNPDCLTSEDEEDQQREGEINNFNNDQFKVSRLLL